MEKSLLEKVKEIQNLNDEIKKKNEEMAVLLMDMADQGYVVRFLEDGKQVLLIKDGDADIRIGDDESTRPRIWYITWVEDTIVTMAIRAKEKETDIKNLFDKQDEKSAKYFLDKIKDYV